MPAEPFIGRSKETRKYLDFIEVSFNARTVPILWGPPGVGKTAIINAVIQRRGMLMRTLIGSTMDPTDVAGLPVLKTLSDGSQITEFTVPDWFHEVAEYARANPQGACIFIDELTTSPPPVQAALLTFIQDRRVGKHYLPDNVLIIAAANPPSQAADGWVLAPPTANRFSHLEFKPSLSDWLEGMVQNWNQPMGDYERSIRKYMVSFLHNNISLVNKMPDNAEEAGKAWPSMRQWDNAARMLGQLTPEQAYLRDVIVKSCVGNEAGSEFIAAMSKMSVVNYDKLITDPESIDWAGLSPDELYLSLSNAIDRVEAGNVDATIRVFQAAGKARKNDVLAGLFPQLAQAVYLSVREAEERIGIRTSLAVLGQNIVAVFDDLVVQESDQQPATDSVIEKDNPFV